jgi:hypothetical protein
MSDASWKWPTWAPRVLWIHRECPHCTSRQFKPAETRPYDGVLSMFALRPIRCMFCWRRYYWIALHEAQA